MSTATLTSADVDDRDDLADERDEDLAPVDVDRQGVLVGAVDDAGDGADDSVVDARLEQLKESGALG